MYDNVEDVHLELFSYLADGLIRDTTPDAIRDYVDKDFDVAKLEEYCKTDTRPSQIPRFKESIKATIDASATSSVRLFVFLMNALDSRVLSPPFTGSLKLIREMSDMEIEATLKSWKDSPISLKRRLFLLVRTLTLSSFVRLTSNLHNEAIGYPTIEKRESLYEGYEEDKFTYKMADKPLEDGHELYMPNIDVLVIGSGCGAGAVVQTLAENGHTCLVLEKGKYFKNSELNFDDYEGLSKLYERNGAFASSSQEIVVLAGSNFGGGSTINWSACLPTPFKVRKEWYDDYGLEWAATDLFDECLQYVWKQIGASLNGVRHSFSNQVLLEGAKKLGYRAKEIAQNNGDHKNHSCGFCYLGCKYGIKQGSTSCWFREAAEKGSQFMDQVRVLRVNHKGGKAISVLCQNTENGAKFTIKGPKKFVVCGGSLNTPILLQQSGFRNKHIGSNLKLHPSTVLFGDFGKRTNPFSEALLTSVVTEVDDLDGKAHGAKIETIVHAPFLEATYYPWHSSTQIRKDILRYNNMSAMLIITRDTSSGTVHGDPEKTGAIKVDYSVNAFDRRAAQEAILKAADILYIEGAKEIIHPEPSIPTFKSNKPKNERSLDDEDYRKWHDIHKKSNFKLYGSIFGSAHQMSSCRMSGKGPSYGACDTKGRLFECKNLFVADASLMPTASGVNPMITVLTMARFVALGIANELQNTAKI